MKLKSLKIFGLIVILIILAGVASFKVNVSFKPNTASASGPACSDGQATCGSFGAIMAGTATCSLNGKMNQPFTATCSTGDNTTILGGSGQQLWFALTKSNSVVIPTTWAGDANYNGGTVFPNSDINVNWGASHAGSVSIGTVNDSFDPCSPYAIGKPGCNGFSSRSVNGTANPGDTINLSVTSLHADNDMNSGCSVGGTCGVWGSGTATVQVNVTACFKSSFPGSPWVDPNNQSLGRRNYVATANGVCSPTNVASSVPVPALSALFTNGNSITATPGTTITIPFTFSNTGAAGSTVHVDGNSGCHITSPNIDLSNLFISSCAGGDYIK